MSHTSHVLTTRPILVCICIATFRRPDGLKRLLEGIAGQSFARAPKPQLMIVVADNEGNARAERVCRDFPGLHKIPLTYVREDRPGISFARNATLQHVPRDADFVAIIDDDEFPESDWLEQLLIDQAATGADVVYGPVIPVFEDGTPMWVKECRYFEKPRNHLELIDRQSISGAATNNVLMRNTMLIDSGVRFDPQFGLSGGEDKVFFQDLSNAGFHFIWAPTARVREVVPPERCTLSFLWKSEYRGGNVRLFMRHRNEKRLTSTKKLKLIVKHVLQSSQKIGNGLTRLMVLACSFRLTKARCVTATFPIAFGIGMLTSTFGIRYEHYARQRAQDRSAIC